MQEIWDALEASTTNSKTGSFERQTPSKRDHLNHRDKLLRFLGEVDPQLSIGEVIAALEEYE